MALDASIAKMEAEGVHPAAIAAFTHAYEALAAGDTGILPEADIEPVNDLPRAAELPDGDPDDLGKAVVVKLNGGLGTVDGHDPRQVAGRGQGRADVPGRDRAPGRHARACRCC